MFLDTDSKQKAIVANYLYYMFHLLHLKQEVTLPPNMSQHGGSADGHGDTR